MATDPFTASPELDVRKRWALMQLQGAGDASPVRHPLAAVARALQGAMGGYMAGQLQAEDDALGERVFGSLPGLGAQPPAQSAPAPMPQPQQPSRPRSMVSNEPAVRVASLAAPSEPLPMNRAPVMPTNKVWGDQEAIDAGLYEPPQTPGARVAQAHTAAVSPAEPLASPPSPAAPSATPAVPAAPPAQQAQAPARTQVNIPPEVAETVRKLGSKRETRAAAWQLYLQYAKPTEAVRPMSPEERKQWNVPEGVSAGLDTVTGKPTFSQPANSVNVNTVANPVFEGVGKHIVEGRQAASAAAREIIPSIHEARRALDEGATTGAFADQRIFLQKVGSLFGLDASQASNSEVLRGVVANNILADIKKLGANPSNTDLRFIEDVKAGRITLEERSMRKLFDIQEKYARQIIRNFNADSDKLMGGNPNVYKDIAPLMKFEEPGQYQSAPKPRQTKTINGKTYYQENGKWYQQ